MDWQTTALIATAASPVVAAIIFLSSAVADAHRRRQDQLRAAIVNARTQLYVAAKRAALPGPFTLIIGWQLTLLGAVAELGLTVDRRRYRQLSVWLVQGAKCSAERESRARIEVLSQLVQVTALMGNGSRTQLDAAQSYAKTHPWPQDRTDAPRHSFWNGTARWALSIIALDASLRRPTAKT